MLNACLAKILEVPVAKLYFSVRATVSNNTASLHILKPMLGYRIYASEDPRSMYQLLAVNASYICHGKCKTTLHHFCSFSMT